MAEVRVSAVVIARNEAHNLGECLDALAWVDERVVVVDAASTDETAAIARARAERVLERRFDTFAGQRNAGREAARGDWVLAVDADERVTPELAAEIRRAIDQYASEYEGYHIPIRSVIFGRPFVASGTQLDFPLRLFRRERGRWVGDVHETVEIEGEIGRLTAPIQHRTHETLGIFLTKLDRYTTLEAAQLAAEGRRPRVFDLTLRPLATFLRLYGARGGFRDGTEGFLFCALSGVSTFVRNAKLREMTRGEGPTRAIARLSGARS